MMYYTYTMSLVVQSYGGLVVETCTVIYFIVMGREVKYNILQLFSENLCRKCYADLNFFIITDICATYP